MKDHKKELNRLTLLRLMQLTTAGALVIALLPIPVYGYFILLRWIVTVTAIWSLIELQRFDPAHKPINPAPVMLFLILITLLMNPLVPVHLFKALWFPIDIVASFLFFKIASYTKYEMNSCRNVLQGLNDSDITIGHT